MVWEFFGKFELNILVINWMVIIDIYFFFFYLFDYKFEDIYFEG